MSEALAALVAALMGIFGPVTALEPAVRGEQVQTQPEPPPPPVPTGLHGKPFAPAGLSNCAEMMFYARQFGLPDRFERIGWRESNCRNEDAVKTWCCHGYWQMFTSLHMKDHRLAPKMRACGVTSHWDLNSNVPIEKQKQACAAKALYDVSGSDPWSATR